MEGQATNQVLEKVPNDDLLAEVKRRWPNALDVELVDDEALVVEFGRRFHAAAIATEWNPRAGVFDRKYRHFGSNSAAIGLCEKMRKHLLRQGLEDDRR